MISKASFTRLLSLLSLSALLLSPGATALRAGAPPEKDPAAKDGSKESNSSPKAPSAEERIGTLEEGDGTRKPRPAPRYGAHRGPAQ